VVGNHSGLLVSELAGRHVIEEKAAELDIEVDSRHVLQHVKALEHAGYQFEAADASFELLLRREAGAYEPLFELESWRVIVEQHGDREVSTEAVIKIRVGGKRIVTHAEGNGPVNALDKALRRAISENHPHLADIELVNYKVRILDETKGTGAVTRVLIDSTDHHETWGSIGVHENVIAASWQALVESLAYAEQPSHVRA
jgi:2-isopropylmalate synthase